MLIPDQVRKCVVFLAFEGTNGVRVAGTGFFLVLPTATDPNSHFIYLVTANHVIAGIRTKSTDGMVRVRYNTKGGGFAWAHVPEAMWFSNPDDPRVNDVAVTPFAIPDDGDVRVLPIEMLATDEVIERQGIGLGDEVITTGLFVNHQGRDRNIPIVRVGNIAAMPEEPIQSRDLGPIDAYLIEARSTGGLSGSPVFVNTIIDRSGDAASTILLSGAFRSSHLFLLGVMHGHWDAPAPKPDDALVLDADLTDGSAAEGVNRGIAIVSPASKILDILNLPVLTAIRALGEQQLAAMSSPTMDSADEPIDMDERHTIDAPFEDAMKALLRTRKPDDQSGDGT